MNFTDWAAFLVRLDGYRQQVQQHFDETLKMPMQIRMRWTQKIHLEWRGDRTGSGSHAAETRL